MGRDSPPLAGILANPPSPTDRPLMFPPNKILVPLVNVESPPISLIEMFVEFEIISQNLVKRLKICFNHVWHILKYSRT